MSFFYFPGDFVYWEKNPSHEKIKNKFLPTIMKLHEQKKNNPFASSKLNTSFSYNENLKDDNSFLNDHDFISKVIFKAIENMTIKHNSKKSFTIIYNGMFVQSSWWNHYDEGHFQEPHIHDGAPKVINNMVFYPAFSVVYILQDNNERSSLFFQKSPPLPFIPSSSIVNFDTSTIDEVTEGTVIVFPSGLTHMAKPSSKPGRITIAFNVYADINFDG